MRCPLSYDDVSGGYSPAALRRLHPRLTDLQPLPFTSTQLREEAAEQAEKLSMQGVQPKLSAGSMGKMVFSSAGFQTMGMAAFSSG